MIATLLEGAIDMRPMRLLAAALLATATIQSASAGHLGGGGETFLPTFLISGPDAIVVPPPPGPAETRAELAALGAEAESVPADLLMRLRRWETGGPVHRWNEAAVTALVDRHTTAGAAARVLALLHVTLHDVGVVVRAAQLAHERGPPAAHDPGLARVPGRFPRTSYPSETAAI
ncbi:hypothetical protein, partial [Elioraea sp.]|uniref:hypothetical protein n=1 Tax=Elioraea sp. TaxID=2185103 RepID=UPI003F6FBF22